MEVQITCDNLKLGYGAGVLVDGLSFTVEKGDYLCIVGENGAGKSTLLRTILGLQKPLAGKITFGGGLQQNEIGYLPQQTFVQRDFPASVWEVVLSGCQGRCGLRPFYNREEKQIAKNAMEQLEIIPLARTCYRDLSGMYRLVERINREMGITVIMISHDILEAIPYATHILHMGREYFFGTVEEYRRSRFGNAFLQPE